MDGYRREAGLQKRGKREPRRETIWELVKRAFSYERDSGIVKVSTVPLITERWFDDKRQIKSFMVTLPRWVTEEEILEAINNGFKFLAEES